MPSPLQGVAAVPAVPPPGVVDDPPPLPGFVVPVSPPELDPVSPPLVPVLSPVPDVVVPLDEPPLPEESPPVLEPPPFDDGPDESLLPPHPLIAKLIAKVTPTVPTNT